jgi:predicted GNAT family N-acyltransferase
MVAIMIVKVKTQKQLDILMKILAENWRKQGYFEDLSKFEGDNHLFLLERDAKFVGTLELKVPKRETLNFFEFLDENMSQYKILEVDKLSIQEEERGLRGMMELFEAGVTVGKELDIDYYVQFMRKSFINILRRRYGFEFHSSSQVLVENGIEFIPVLVDVKDGFEKFDRLHSKVEKVQ